MKQGKVDHYKATYSTLGEEVYADVRARTFGEDYGQNGWQTSDELDLFVSWMQLDESKGLLDVACGSGGPTLRIARLTGCGACGVDVHNQAVETARAQAAGAKLSGRVRFQLADANKPLPLADESFDALICIDAVNHLPDRASAFCDWARVLRVGARVVVTNALVLTGQVSGEELAIRASFGLFPFYYVPLGFDDALLEKAGLRVVERHDRTENIAQVAARWHSARDLRSDDLRRIEGEVPFENLQAFLQLSSQLASERRLSRLAYFAERVR
jgi:SAM-dependent methyltransferase